MLSLAPGAAVTMSVEPEREIAAEFTVEEGRGGGARIARGAVGGGTEGGGAVAGGGGGLWRRGGRGSGGCGRGRRGARSSAERRRGGRSRRRACTAASRRRPWSGRWRWGWGRWWCRKGRSRLRRSGQIARRRRCRS